MKYRSSLGSRAFDVANFAFMILVSVTFIFPFYVIVMNSFTAEKFLTSGSINLWPQEFSIVAYSQLFLANSKLVRAFIVSISSTILGTMQGMLVTLLFGYAMAKDDFPFKRIIMFFVIFTMIFSGGLIPTYLLFQEMHLTDTFYVLMIFNIFNPFYMIFIRNYFMSIPPAVRESAQLDGASEFQIFARIMVPLAKPMIACMALFTAVDIYNDFATPMFYTRSEKWVTLQLLLKRVLYRVDALSSKDAAVRANESAIPINGMKAATVVIVLIPILMVYPFAQKYFIAGVWTGAMKE